MKTGIKFGFGSLLCTLLLLAGCGRAPEAEQRQAPESAAAEAANRVVLRQTAIREIGLEIVTVQQRPLTGTITAPAELRPNQDREALVGTLVPGRVSEVLVRLGDRVRPGEPLMRVEGGEVGEIKARFIKAQAQRDFTAANLERQKLLAGEKIGSQKTLQEAQAAYDQALAEYHAEDRRIHAVGLDHGELEGELALAAAGGEHRSGSLTITAPIGGVVVERSVVIGQAVDAGTTAFRIIDPSVLWADAQLFEKDLPLVAGQPEIRFQTTAWPGTAFTGRLIHIGEMVDEQSRTVLLRAEIANPQRLLKSGMFGEMVIPAGGRGRGLMVPAEALFREEGGWALFVALDDTTFVRRPVETGLAAGTETQINSGLREGERIVSRGAFYLRSELNKSEFAEEEE